jgi:hypothetical protein
MTENLPKEFPFKLMSKRRLIVLIIILFGGFNLGIFGLWYWLDVIVDVGRLPSDRIVTASQMILQFVSFLVGGWIVGFFYFYGNIVKEARRLGRVAYRLKLLKSKEPKDYLKEEPWEKEIGRFPLMVLSLMVGDIGVFAVSGVSAIGGVLTQDGHYVLYSLWWLVGGLWLMLTGWHGMQYNLGLFHAFYDKYGALVDGEPDKD